MVRTRSPGRAVLILGGVVALVLAAPFALRFSGLHAPLGVRLIIALVVVTPALVATCYYWRNIDEAAREAQKWAWFWGGSMGMAVAAIVLALSFARPEWLDLSTLLPHGATPLLGMFYGGLVVIVLQLAGFLAAWVYWWAKRR